MLDAHVYADDGVSGAEFDRRPGFLRLLEALRQRPRPFDVLLITDKDRLGREQYETAFVLKLLLKIAVALEDLFQIVARLRHAVLELVHLMFDLL